MKASNTKALNDCVCGAGKPKPFCGKVSTVQSLYYKCTSCNRRTLTGLFREDLVEYWNAEIPKEFQWIAPGLHLYYKAENMIATVLIQPHPLKVFQGISWVAYLKDSSLPQHITNDYHRINCEEINKMRDDYGLFEPPS